MLKLWRRRSREWKEVKELMEEEANNRLGMGLGMSIGLLGNGLSVFNKLTYFIIKYFENNSIYIYNII